MTKKYQTVGKSEDEALEVARDDVSGVEVDPEQVKRARAEEPEYLHKMKWYDESICG